MKKYFLISLMAFFSLLNVQTPVAAQEKTKTVKKNSVKKSATKKKQTTRQRKKAQPTKSTKTTKARSRNNPYKNKLKKKTTRKGATAKNSARNKKTTRRVSNRNKAGVSGYKPRKNVIYSVFDLDKGIYLEKNLINKVHPLASLTKLMSAHVFLDNKRQLQNCSLKINDLDRDRLKNTRSRLPKNKPLECEDLLKATLAISDNYAASALSRGLNGKDKDDFVQMMNQQAKKWGMKNTSFSDPAGLNPRNRSTAHDLNVFLQNLRQTDRYQILSHFSVENKFKLPNYKVANNSNMLIRNNNFDAKLSKTGFINESGYNLVFVPEQCAGNKKLALVIMGERNSFSRAALARDLLNKYKCK